MSKRLLLTGMAGLLALAVAASPAYAQRGGRGGGGGGGWSGGSRYAGGGGYGGGGYGGYGRGYNGGYGYGGYGRGYGYGGYGVGIGIGLGAPYLGGGYSDGYYGSPDSYAYGMYSNLQPMAPAGPGLSNYQAQMNSEPTGNSVAMQSFYSGPSTNTGRSDLTVKVPADAQVWLNTIQSGQQGTERHFGFPSLVGGDNVFTVRATWTDNGQTVTRERQVNIKAGANTTVDLTQANTTTDKAAPSNPNVGHPMQDDLPGGQKVVPPVRPDTGIKN